MKKTIKKLMIGVLLVIVTISALFGITNSKYLTKVTGDGETEIAKWYFNVNGETESMATIDLAKTYNPETLINGKIAPGTSGSFDLLINAADSDVGVNYVVDFKNETNKPTNLKFKHGNDRLDEIEDLEEFLTGTIDANDTNKTRTLTIEWEWLYETGENASEISANDEIDRNEGLQALDYSFDVVVTGTQVVPSV